MSVGMGGWGIGGGTDTSCDVGIDTQRVYSVSVRLDP